MRTAIDMRAQCHAIEDNADNAPVCRCGALLGLMCAAWGAALVMRTRSRIAYRHTDTYTCYIHVIRQHTRLSILTQTNTHTVMDYMYLYKYVYMFVCIP